jgi:hypothetical protein
MKKLQEKYCLCNFLCEYADRILNIELFFAISCTYKLFNGFYKLTYSKHAYCIIPNNILFFIIGFQNPFLMAY